jgi:hypothetical protein
MALSLSQSMSPSVSTLTLSNLARSLQVRRTHIVSASPQFAASVSIGGSLEVKIS